VAAGSRHAGEYDVTKYRVANGNSYCVEVRDEYVRLDGIQVYMPAASGDWIAFYARWTDARYIQVRHCLANGNGVGAGQGFALGDDGLYYNNFALNCTTTGFSRVNTTNANVFNCTVRGSTSGFTGHWTNNVVLKNCLATGCTTGYSSTFDSSSDYNAASDETAPGANSVNNATISFTSTTSCLLAASGNDEILGAGVDLSATFTTDIQGETRPTGSGTWDIGADEYVAAGGGLSIPVAMYHYLHH
jgi:hypothetical protein